MGDRRFSYAAKSGAVVRYARLDWKRERTRSRKDRARAEQRADIPAARRNCARHARMVQIAAGRSKIEVARGGYTQTRDGSFECMAQTKRIAAMSSRADARDRATAEPVTQVGEILAHAQDDIALE